MTLTFEHARSLTYVTYRMLGVSPQRAIAYRRTYNHLKRYRSAIILPEQIMTLPRAGKKQQRVIYEVDVGTYLMGAAGDDHGMVEKLFVREIDALIGRKDDPEIIPLGKRNDEATIRRLVECDQREGEFILHTEDEDGGKSPDFSIMGSLPYALLPYRFNDGENVLNALFASELEAGFYYQDMLRRLDGSDYTRLDTLLPP